MWILTKYLFDTLSMLTLRAKMLLYVGGGTTIILVIIQMVQLFGIPFFKYEGEYAQQSKKIYTETQVIADFEKNLMGLWFTERLADLRVLSQQKVVAKTLDLAMADGEQSTKEVREVAHPHQESDELVESRMDLQMHMQSIRSAYGFYDVIDVVAANSGRTLASTEATHLNERHVLAEQIFSEQRLPVIQKIIFKKVGEHGSPALFIAAMVESNSSAQPIGAVIIQISTDVLIDKILMARRSLGSTGEVILIDMQKRLLTPLGHPLPDGSVADPLDHILTTQAAEFAAWGVDSLIEHKDYRGVDVIAAVRHIRLTEDFAISMIVNRDRAELYVPVWNNLFVFMVIAFVGLGAVLALVIIVSRQLAKPLEQLSKAAKLIDKGDLGARIPELSGVEAVSLANAFNGMAATVEKSQITLQEQVELRTEALRSISIRQDAILTAVPDILVEIDSDLNYTWANSTGLAFFGDGVIGNSILNYFVDDLETAKEIQLLFSGSTQLLALESRQRRSDGSIRILAWRCKALVAEDEQAIAVLASARDITERKWAEIELQNREERFRELLNNIPDLVWLKDIDGVYLACNSAFERFFGAKDKDIIGKTDYDFVDRDLADFFRMHDKNAINAGKSKSNEEWVTFPDSTEPTLLYTTKTPMYEINGEFSGVLGIGRDITEIKKNEAEKRKLQEQLQHAQKIEAVGRLAGGVAHDFNNMLSVILGHAELALGSVTSESPIVDDIQEIIIAAKRSGSLTRQLLAFARKQTITPRILDLNSCIQGTLSMLGRLIGENIELVWKPSSQKEIVKIDPTQVEQVLANLCINSKDAIADTGKITISTGRTSVDEKYCETHPDVTQGDYVTLTVLDDGVGMSAATLENIFEPFYTTKEQGKGTGLGLATVYGIVKQNHGAIDVISNQEAGTCFTIYLPMYLLEETRIRERDDEIPTGPGDETILIIEDEPTLLSMATRMLKKDGYRVYGVTTPEQAFDYATKHKDNLNLIITDVIMPEMNGRDLIEKLQDIVPGCRCLYMSGYTADVIARHGVLEEGVHFIAKPFTRKELITKVRHILDGLGAG